MNKDFMEYVYKRIETACKENEEYMELQSQCAAARKNNNSDLYEYLTCNLETKAEELCYLQGFNDGAKMILGMMGED